MVDHHLARRAHELAHQVSHVVRTTRFNDGAPGEHTLPPVAAATLVLGLVIFVVSALAIQYTYGMVVVTLACIEDTDSVISLPATNETRAPLIDKKTGTAPPEASTGGPSDILTPPRLPITRSWRSATQHLRARAGRWSRFRGLGIFIVYSLLRDVVASALGLRSRVLLPVGQIAAEIIFANLVVTWVHTVISEPMTTSWWKRIPGFAIWKKAAPAVAVKAVACQLTAVLAMCAKHSFDSIHPQDVMNAGGDLPKHHVAISLAGGLGYTLLSLLLVVGIEIPATVAMVRVVASLLPEHIEPIVPFDRTYEGKFVSESEGGSGVVSMADAWRTFSWPARMRLMRIAVKVFAVITTLLVALGLVWAGIFLAASDGKF